MDIETCVIPLFQLNVAWEACLWHPFCISASLNIKIQDGHRRPYWKCNFKINWHWNPCNTTFPTKCAWKVHFWHRFCILTSLIKQTSAIGFNFAMHPEISGAPLTLALYDGSLNIILKNPQMRDRFNQFVDATANVLVTEVRYYHKCWLKCITNRALSAEKITHL